MVSTRATITIRTPGQPTTTIRVKDVILNMDTPVARVDSIECTEIGYEHIGPTIVTLKGELDKLILGLYANAKPKKRKKK